MLKQSMKLIAAFPTTTDAMHMQTAADRAGLEGRLIPVPGQISAGCGLAWCSEAALKDRVKEIIRNSGIAVDGYYEMMW